MFLLPVRVSFILSTGQAATILPEHSDKSTVTSLKILK